MPDTPRSRTWLWVILGGGAFLLFILAMFSLAFLVLHNSGESTSAMNFGEKIGVIDLDGVILDSTTFNAQLKKFADDDSIKAIIIHVNSPGGGVAASEEIYRAVKRVRDEKKKRIVASISTVGASGAYYVSSATNKIFADSGSVVGSIGVIAEWVNYGDLMRWVKLKSEVLTVGKFKDTGDPSREMTPEERAYMQSLIDNMYGQFIHDVAVGRHTTDDKIAPLATGQVWTGEQAQPLGLIDAQGGYRVALMNTARAVGIQGEPHIVRPRSDKRGIFTVLNDDADDLFPNPSQLLNRSPGFYYLWK